MDIAWQWNAFKKVFWRCYFCETAELMLREKIDYYINEDGNFVFTKEYHLKRGFCCKNKCLHCPWDFGKPQDKGTENNSNQTEGDKKNN